MHVQHTHAHALARCALCLCDEIGCSNEIVSVCDSGNKIVELCIYWNWGKSIQKC